MYKPPLTLQEVHQNLSILRPIKYNRFRWWRMYEKPNKKLPKKSPLINKILNGDFDYSHYAYQAMLCEYQLNDLWEQCCPDLIMYSEKGKMLKLRLQKLWEDFDKNETQCLEDLVQEFKKQFGLSESTIYREMENSELDLIQFYYYIKNDYIKSIFKIFE